jgi:hypothetical protein
MDKSQIQSVANDVCKKYGIKSIPIRFTDRKYRGGLAYYATHRIRVGGKIIPTNYADYIMICDWDNIKATGRFPILQVAHELAHHVMNMKTNSLAHSGKHGNLEDTIGLSISRKLRG